MRIASLRVRAFEIAPPPAVRTARGALARRDGLLLQLGDENGRTGWGEASPLPGFSPDATGDAREALAAIEPLLPLELDLCLPVAPQVRALLRQAALPSPSAAFAFETALFDLAGQALHAPAACFLRGAWPRDPIEVNALLPGDAPAEAIAAAHRWGDAGFRTFKVKLGTDGERERATLAALRREFGSGIVLRGDANGAWTENEARARLEELAPIGLEYLEEPSAGALARLCGSPVTLAADESLAGVPDPSAALDALLSVGAIGVLVLKPALLGGACVAHDLARRAAPHGVRAVVTMLFDGPVARAAATQLAFALDPAPLACGLAPAAPDRPGASAWIAPPERPGLGLSP